MPPKVDCQLRKWDGRPSYSFEAINMGRDDHGTWLGLPPPTRYVGPKGPGVWHHAFVICVPDGEWWIASFNDERDPERVELYVDMTTPPERTNDSAVACVDLDLDVARYYDGRVELLDEDDFEKHRAEMDYPDDVVKMAWETGQWVLEAVRARREPFGDVGREWLAKVLRGEVG
jgi:hypothetical protein